MERRQIGELYCMVMRAGAFQAPAWERPRHTAARSTLAARRHGAPYAGARRGRLYSIVLLHGLQSAQDPNARIAASACSAAFSALPPALCVSRSISSIDFSPIANRSPMNFAVDGFMYSLRTLLHLAP
jgi:hypothetical protein